MPTTQIELTGISCHVARRIIDAGVDQLRQLFSDGDVFSYSCNANEWNETVGSISFGQTYPHPPDWIGFVVIYALCVLVLQASLQYLRHNGASVRDLFYWGALALIVPFLGPLVVLLFYRISARSNG